MAKLTSARNEPQDPSLPQKQRARWRFIGATVLALGAMIVLPLALESEPRRPLTDLSVTIPDRAELGRQNQAWPDVAYRSDAAGRAGDGEDRPGLFTRDEPAGAGSDSSVAGESPVDLERTIATVTAGGTAVATAAVSSLAGVAATGSESRTPPVSDPAREIVSTRDASKVATSAASGSKAADAAAGEGKAADAKAADAKAAQAKSAQAKETPATAAESGAAKPANLDGGTRLAQLDQKAATASAPPMPERRTDRNQAGSASPGGFVVQIGAFSSRKGATAQLDRARKLGFKPYSEPFKTREGEIIRVRVGPFLNRSQADEARAKLRRSGIETTLIAP